MLTKELGVYSAFIPLFTEKADRLSNVTTVCRLENLATLYPPCILKSVFHDNTEYIQATVGTAVVHRRLSDSFINISRLCVAAKVEDEQDTIACLDGYALVRHDLLVDGINAGYWYATA